MEEKLKEYGEMVESVCAEKQAEFTAVTEELVANGYVERNKVIGCIQGVVDALQQGIDLINNMPEEEYAAVMKMLSENHQNCCCESAAMNYVPNDAEPVETVDL